MGTLSDPVEELLLIARKIREDQDVFTPIITWQPEAGDALIAHLTSITGDTKSDLDTAFQTLRDMTGAPSWFAVTLDSYARDGDGSDLEGTTLEEAFLQGDLRTVEQMVVIIMTPDTGELTMIRQIYRWIPSEGWEWSEPELVESPDDAVTTAVRMYR